MATLLDAFRKATKDSNVFGEYIEYHSKYIRVLMAGSDCMLEDIRECNVLNSEESELFQDMSMLLVKHYRAKCDTLKAELFELLKGIDLMKIKIMGYTEFDMVEWDLDKHVWNHLEVKFKPKDVAVSFWNYKAEDIEYNF